MNRKNVGLIGTGLLGTAIADRLMSAGFQVWGHDCSSKAMASFARQGGQTVAQITDIPVASSTIILSLPTSKDVQEVLKKIAPRLSSDSVVIDTTTGDPNQTAGFGQQLAKRQIELLDASVLGSSEMTRNGDSVLLVGASDRGYEAANDVLTTISNTIHHVGEVGSGQKMKLVANLVLGLNRAVLAEGLHFAKSFSLNPKTVLDVLQSGAAYSRVMDTKGQKMIDEDFEPQARLSQHLKDVNLILDHAEKQKSSLPLSELHKVLLQKVEDNGDGSLDNSAIVKAWDQALSFN